MDRAAMIIASVPSLYVRVYHEHRRPYFLGGCSLTICEGISPRHWHIVIEMGVPSLYVRVYRRNKTALSRVYSSLTICEGISLASEQERLQEKFPHYM